MKYCKLFFMWLLLIVLSPVSFAQFPQSLNQQIQTMIDEYRVKNQFGAYTLAISFPDEQAPRIFNSGHVSETSSYPPNIGNLFQIGSISKSFIAVIILQLQKENKLSLNDKLGFWLPEYANWSGITIKQLLNHTSGIYNFTDSKEFREKLLTNPMQQFETKDLIAYAQKEPLYFEPGQGWKYSNTGYILLGLIIEQITQQKIEDVIDTRILKNLQFNLSNTFFISHFSPDFIQNRMIHGYYQLSPDYQLDVTDFSMSWLKYAGSMISNTYDITHWLRLLFSNQILDKASFEEFTSLVSVKTGHPLPAPDDVEPVGYGLAIQAYKTDFDKIDTVWWHSGGTIGYKSLMIWLPKQKIAISLDENRIIAGKEVSEVPFIKNQLVQELLKLISEHAK